MKKHLGPTLLSIAVITFSFGYFIHGIIFADEPESVQQSDSNSSSGSYNLKVEGYGNNPKPVDYDLQGSKNKLQKNQSLQNTTSGSALQPNAKTDQLEN